MEDSWANHIASLGFYFPQEPGLDDAQGPTLSDILTADTVIDYVAMRRMLLQPS